MEIKESTTTEALRAPVAKQKAARFFISPLLNYLEDEAIIINTTLARGRLLLYWLTPVPPTEVPFCPKAGLALV